MTMATLHWPGGEIARDPSFIALRDIPFVLTADENYPDGINLYTSALAGSLPPSIIRTIGSSCVLWSGHPQRSWRTTWSIC